MKPFLTAIIAACALGAGITGMLLWMQNQTSPQKATVTAAPTTAPPTTAPLPPNPGALPATQDPQSGSQKPPATLTLGLSPNEAALALGNWNYDHEKWDEATRNYRRAIEGGLDNPDVRTDLGNALRFSDHPQEALQQYQLAQKQNPSHEQSLFNQGALYAVSLHNPRKGVAAWRAYLKRFPAGGSATKARELLAKFAKNQ